MIKNKAMSLTHEKGVPPQWAAKPSPNDPDMLVARHDLHLDTAMTHHWAQYIEHIFRSSARTLVAKITVPNPLIIQPKPASPASCSDGIL